MKEDKGTLVLKIYLLMAAIIHSRLQIDSRNPHYVKDTLFLCFVTLKLLRKQGDTVIVPLLCPAGRSIFFFFKIFFKILYERCVYQILSHWVSTNNE